MTGSRAYSARGPLAAILGALLLAGCGGDGQETVRAAGLAYDSLAAALGVADDAPAPPQPSYEEVAQLPFATLAFRIRAAGTEDAPPAILAAAVADQGRVWYLDGARRGFAASGGRIVGTRGLQTDVLGGRLDPADPIAHPRALADWPAQPHQVLQRRRDALGQEHVRAFVCRMEVLETGLVELYRSFGNLTHVRERCGNARGGYVNEHWIDPADGRVWKSVQWAGPDVGALEFAVIRPFVEAN